MSKYRYSETERQINNVLIHQSEELAAIETPCLSSTEDRIAESEELLRNLGYGAEITNARLENHPTEDKKIMVIPSWEQLFTEA